MKIDKVYIITLDHSVENKTELLNRMMGLGFHDSIEYYVFEGVEGKTKLTTESDRAKYGVKLYDGWVLDDTDIKWWSRNVTVGEAGGMCSHIKVWEDAYENGYENILILEDDFEPLHPFFWNAYDEIDGYDYDITFLSRILQTSIDGVTDSEVGLDFWVKPGYSYQTHSYMLTKEGIRKLIETNVPTLKDNIVVSDEFLPATYTWHPRSDMRSLFIQNMNALAYRWNPIDQTRHQGIGNSQTEPIEGIDY
jgi:collagen beta-1,O-galactosyltransferase